MLEVANLRFEWPEQQLRFDLDVETGEVLILRGASGIGKSTLLALIAGLLEPQSGTILWHGEDITRLPAHARPLSLLFQEHNLFGHLDCAGNIGLGIDPGLKLDDAQKRMVSDAMVELGIGGMEGRLPDTLSGGQQQRVALARALLRARRHHRKGSGLLLLDEPFAALDPETRAECIGVTSRLIGNENLTAIVVSHDREDEKLLGGRVLELRDAAKNP